MVERSETSGRYCKNCYLTKLFLAAVVSSLIVGLFILVSLLSVQDEPPSLARQAPTESEPRDVASASIPLVPSGPRDVPSEKTWAGGQPSQATDADKVREERLKLTEERLRFAQERKKLAGAKEEVSAAESRLAAKQERERLAAESRSRTEAEASRQRPTVNPHSAQASSAGRTPQVAASVSPWVTRATWLPSSPMARGQASAQKARAEGASCALRHPLPRR